MAGDVLNILAGFMKGKNKRRQEDLQLQQLKEQTRAKLSAEKIALEKEKRATLQFQQKQKLIDMLMQQYTTEQGAKPGEAQTTPMGSSITDALSAVDMPGGTTQPPQQGASPAGKMSPISMALAKEATDIDFLGAGRLTEQQASNKRLTEQGAARLAQQTRGNDIREKGYERGFGEYTPIKIQIPGGGEQTALIPKFLNQPGGGQPPTIQTKPSFKEMPIDEQNLPLWRNKETLESPPIGTTPKQAQEQGYVRVTTGQLDAVQSFGQVENILAQIDGLMGKVFPDKKEGAMGRVVGGTMRVAGAISQADPDAATLMGLINGTLAPIIRSMGEKGNLSDTDIKRAANLFPKLSDSGTVAWQRLEQLKTLIREGKEKKLGGVMEKVTQRKSGESISEYLKRTQK